MDCLTARERLVPWLDDEISPGERDQIERHIEQCPACATAAGRLAEQQDVLARLRPPEHLPLTKGPAFWDRLDGRLSVELDRADQPAANPPAANRPLLERELRVSGRAALAYAAILAASLLWGWRAHSELERAVESSKQLNLALEREQRLSDEPSPLQQGDSFRTVDYTPSRGSF